MRGWRWGKVLIAMFGGVCPVVVEAQAISLDALVGTWVGGARGYYPDSEVETVTDSVLQAVPDTLRIWPDTTFSTKDMASMAGYVPSQRGEVDFELRTGFSANRNRFRLRGDTLVWAFPWADSTGVVGTRTLRFLLELDDQQRLVGMDLTDSRRQTSIYRRIDRSPAVGLAPQ